MWQLQQLYLTQYPKYWGKRPPEAEGLIFLSKFGTPLSNNTLDSVLKKAVIRMNQKLPQKEQLPPITAHSFRDTFASICYEQSIPIKETQQLMGHSDQSMTLYYTAVSKNSVSEQLERLHKALDL